MIKFEVIQTRSHDGYNDMWMVFGIDEADGKVYWVLEDGRVVGRQQGLSKHEVDLHYYATKEAAELALTVAKIRGDAI